MSRRRTIGVCLFLALLTFSLPAAASTASALLPPAAPHGARAILTGSGLDDAALAVSFSDGAGGALNAVIVSRTATTLELIVPPAAASGTVRLTNGAAPVATFAFTLLPDPQFLSVATRAASTQAHDVVKQPAGVAVSRGGAVYVADTAHNNVKLIASDGQVIATVGTGVPGLADGPAAAAKFKQPRAIVLDAAGTSAYVADTDNNVIRRIAADGNVTTFAGSGAIGDGDGPANVATFKQPSGLAFDAAGNLFVADRGNHRIRVVTPAGIVSTVAGGVHEGYADGAAAQALFKEPAGVAVSSTGTIFVADSGNHRIRRIEGGEVSTVAGSGAPGLADGSGAAAQFNQPAGIAVDDGGSVFVADSGNHAVRKISIGPNGAVVTTVSGNGSLGFIDGAAAAARWKSPAGVAADGALVVADSGNDAVRLIYPQLSLSASWPRAGALAGGATVRIFGSGFVPGVTQVWFGDAAAADVRYVSSTEVLALAPAHPAGTVDLRVATPAGTATLAGAFTYLPPPSLASVAPRKGRTSGGETLSVSGANFYADGTTATLGGAPAAVTVSSTSELVVITPAGAAGAADLTVTTPGGSATLPGAFTYFAPPSIDGFSPPAGRVGDSVTIDGSNFDPDAAGDRVTIGGVAASVSSASATSLVAIVPAGAASGPITVITAGGSAVSSANFTVIVYVSVSVSPATVTLDRNQTAQLTATATLVGGGTVDVTAQATWGSSNPAVATVGAGSVRAIATGTATISATFVGLQGSAAVTVRNPEPVPVDPATIATKLDPVAVGMFVDEIKFLYTGPNAIQTGVAANAIDEQRATVVRGSVKTLAGAALPAVKVTALGHPELGQTLTRADGVFDFVINGGGALTLQFTKNGYVGAQRTVSTVWGQQTSIGDLALVGYDAQVSEIVSGAAAQQVARGSVIDDSDGTRRATLLVPPGTNAVLALPDGTTQAQRVLHVRATEFSVGPNGPKAMPAALPAASGYTYCVELSADEASSAGASEIRFSRPVAFYIENFLGFAPGTIVPVGYYDRRGAKWVPSDNGAVLKVLSVTGGLADLDLNGDGAPDSAAALVAAGIDDAERQTLATLYAPGQTLWRAAITHFTPFDLNFSFRPPFDAVWPTQPQPSAIRPPSSAQDKSGNVCHASAVNCYSATLTESIPIVGTPFALEYDSSRVAPTQSSMTVNLTGATIPASLKRVELSIGIAGVVRTLSFPPGTNLTYDFGWDGGDVYGRKVQGARDASVIVTYVYDAVYGRPTDPTTRAFGTVAATTTTVRARVESSLNQTFTVRLGHVGVENAGFGNWTFSAQRFYDGRGGTIYDAGGTQRNGDPLQNKQLATTRFAGNGTFRYSGDGGSALSAGINAPNYVASGPDGAVYICDSPSGGGCARIRRIDPNTGMINTVAGTATTGFTPDGGLALGNPIHAGNIAVAPDNTIYFIEDFRLRRISDGILSTVAGNGSQPPSSFYTPPNGSVAAQVPMAIRAFAAGRDGTIHLSLNSGAVLRVAPDGRITDTAQISNVKDMAVSPQGDVYACNLSGEVWRIHAETGASDLLGGDFAAGIVRPVGLSFAGDGTLLVSDSGGGAVSEPRILAIGPDDKTIPLIGTGKFSDFFAPPPEGALARSTPVSCWGVTASPDGSVFYIDQSLGTVRRAAGVFPPLRRSPTAVPSPDGSAAFVFENGRHTSTVETTAGSTIYSLGYDANGLLTSVTDADGNVTTIERLADGTPTGITAPGGQHTTLRVVNERLTSVTNPAGESVAIGYDTAGLLSDFRDARQGLHHFTYDAKGLVTRDDAPDGSFLTLSRAGAGGDNYTVVRTTAEGRVHTYKVITAADTTTSREHDQPDGTALKTSFSGASTTTRTADGSVSTTSDTPDPRFGMAAPFTGSAAVTAGNLKMTASTTSSVARDPNNPLALSSLSSTFTLNGKQWQSTYDGTTRQMTTISPAGRRSSSLLDARARLSSTTTPGLASVNVTYGGFGLISSLSQGSRTSSFTYDARRRLETATDPLQRTIRFGYDDADRLTSETLPGGRVVAFGYDANGNVTSVTPPSRPQHLFTFTAADIPASYTAPSSAATTYTYNRDRQLTLVQRPGGSTIAPGYDNFGRLSSLKIGRGVFTYTYDPATAQLRFVTAPGGAVLAYAYNGPLLTSVTTTGPFGSAVQFGYDTNLRLSTETAAGTAVSYRYDADGLMIGAGALTMTRDPQNGLLTGTLLGSVSDVYTYNAFAEPLTYTATSTSGGLFSETFTRDDAGRISHRVENVAGVTRTYDYFYDPAGRLSDVIQDTNLTRSYRYDDNGNRLQMLVNGTSVASGSYDDQDRVQTYADAVYVHTPAGELAERRDASGTTAFTYDELGNLTKVVSPSGTTIDYVTDGQNRRIGRKVDGSLVQGFVYADQLRIIAELDGTGAVVSRFVYGTRANVPDFMIRSGATYRILSDQLGSPRLIVDTATGAIAQQLDYDEFGNVVNDTNPGWQPFGFAGGLYDPATHLLRFGARDYDPQTGRFVSKDAELFVGGDTNLYSYVVNDPVNLIDPRGTDWVDTTANISAGIGDALLFGFGNDLREWTDRQLGWHGGALVDRCSGSYRNAVIGTTIAMTVAGSGRLAYAGAAKAISLTAATAEEAVNARNALKVAFRLGLDQTSRVYSVEQMIAKYGSEEAVIAAAGRTNAGFNAAGASALGGAANSILGLPECGCR